jgi:hypothetical protein
MKRFTTALLSSLQGLTLNPDDQIGKQIMARVYYNQLSIIYFFYLIFFQHLQAVLQNTDDEESTVNMQKESNDHTKEIIAIDKKSDASNTKLLMCRSTRKFIFKFGT